MKLNYWIADNLRDSSCYSIRAKTKKAVNAQLGEIWNPADFDPARKVTIIYSDAFDLALQLLGEGGAEYTR